MRDCVIIGGGPAGLTAAIYLARYHLSVTVFDDKTGRAASIAISHNHAGFPDGISGHDLLTRMRTQALKYGVQIRYEHVTELQKVGSKYTINSALGSLDARAVLIATGVVNERPPMPDELHDNAVARGLIRYCPVCDGFEITDKRVGVLGSGSRAFKEAVFLRSFTKDLTLIADAADHRLSAQELARLEELGVTVAEGPVVSIALTGNTINVTLKCQEYSFASIYPARGSQIRSALAAMVGAVLSHDGCIIVDSHQRANVSGLYAAGDVVIGLDQISHAMGQAGVAATAIRNDLAEQAALVRR